MPEANTPLDSTAPRLCGTAGAAFASHQPARRPGLVFRGRITPAYSLACLRIDPVVTDGVARLATELLATLCPDGTLTRWKTIPNFLLYRICIPFGPAWPGRTDGHAPPALLVEAFGVALRLWAAVLVAAVLGSGGG